MKLQDKRVVYWLEGEPAQNFGDYLTVYLCQELVDRLHTEGAIFRFIGSTISEGGICKDLYEAGAAEDGKVIFWGCGARDDQPLPPNWLAKAEFFGVRGPLTRDVLGLPARTTLGDPAFLLPLFHRQKVSARTSGKTVCIPHYHDPKDDAAILHATGVDLILRPQIKNDLGALQEIIDDIASADFVLAGSLHAAIVACAYDRPFCFYDSGHVDIPFKWRDFAASIGLSTYFVGNVADGRSIYAQFIDKRISKPPLFPILAGAPFLAKMPMLLAAARHDAAGAMNEEHFVKLVETLDGVLDRSELVEENARTVAAMKREIAEKTDHVACLEDRLRERDSKLDEAEKSAHEKDQRLAALESELALLPEIEARLGEAQARLDECETSAHEKDGRLAALEGALSAGAAEAIRLKGRAEAAEEDNNLLKAEIGQLKSQLVDSLLAFESAMQFRARAETAEARLAAEIGKHETNGQGQAQSVAEEANVTLPQQPENKIGDNFVKLLAPAWSLSANVVADWRYPRKLRGLKKFLSLFSRKRRAKLRRERREYAILKRSTLFSPQWYLNAYPQLDGQDWDPILHYIRYGWRLGYRPGPSFDGTRYLAENPVAGDVNPLWHFLVFGVSQGRFEGTPFEDAFLKA